MHLIDGNHKKVDDPVTIDPFNELVEGRKLRPQFIQRELQVAYIFFMIILTAKFVVDFETLS